MNDKAVYRTAVATPSLLDILERYLGETLIPDSGRRTCMPFSLDRRQLGLVREDGQSWDYGNERKICYFWKPRICPIMVL